MMLEVNAISIFYGRVRALRDVSLTVNQGEIVTLIGANGAGKSTLLNAISGVIAPRNGGITLKGKPIAGLPCHKMVCLGLGYVPEGRQLFGSMSVLDNLVLGGYARCSGDWRHLLGPARWFTNDDSVCGSLQRVLDLFPILRERQSQHAGSLSGGEQQMLAIGRALMSAPEILLLDEPSTGLAPQVVREILRLLVRLRQEGLTVLLVEQDAAAALKIADRGYVMERGRIVIEGSARDLLGDEKVRQAYLGKTRGEAAG